MLKPPFGRFAARFSVFQAASFYMMSLRFLPEDECDVIEPPTVFYKSLRWLRDRGAVDSFATLLIFIEEMISADVNPQKSQTSIKKPSRSPGSRVCVLKLYFSFVFVFIRGELKCCNPPPRLQVVRFHMRRSFITLVLGAALRGSAGIRRGNRSEQG